MRFQHLFLPVALFLVYASAFAQPSAFHPEGDATAWTAPPTPEPETDLSASTEPNESMPLKAKIAQLMLVTLEGVTKPSTNDIAFLKGSVPGGVVLQHAFKAGTATTYINMLRALGSASKTPLLIGTDLYRLTSGNRLIPSDFVQLPSLMSITASGDGAVTKSLGVLLARHILFMGFNFHFGPSFELAPTVPDAIDSIQTFGSDPRFASEAGALFFEAFTENGVLLTPTGFPGGGMNRIGRGAAVLTTPRAVLPDSDGLPYLTLIKSGLKMLHVGNVLSPTLDAENRPASMSPVVISDILRKEMGFQGVVVAGPMDDEVLQVRYDPGEAAVKSLAAGADMLYWSGGISQVQRALSHVEAAVAGGVISEERIDESIARILALKQDLPKPEKPITDRQAMKEAGQKDLFEASLSIERHAITLLKNDNNVLPLVDKASTPVGITGVTGVEELHSLLEKELKPLAQQRITTARHINEIQRFEIDRLTQHTTGMRTVICILTDGIRVESQMELVSALKDTGARVVVLYLGHPRNAGRLTEADAVLLAYCDSVSIAQTIRAAADILMGKAPLAFLPFNDVIKLRVGDSRTFNVYEIIRAPSGRLPIDLSEQFPAGTAASYNPAEAVKQVEWDFAGKKTRKESVVHNFESPGEFKVAVTVTDIYNETKSKEFTVVVSE